MSLTGSFFLDGIIVLTIASFIGLVVVWPRLTPRTPWHVAGRVAALGLVNLLVLLTAATQLNAAYLFFAGWGDLQGALTGHVAQTSLHRGGLEAGAPNLAVRGHAAPVAAVPSVLREKIGANGLVSYTVHGPLSGLTGQILVQLPAGYTSAAAARRRYPVLEAFHGYPGAPLNWIKVFHLQWVIQAAVVTHRLRPTLVVIPQVEIPRGVNSEGVNGGPRLPQVETWLTRDVPTWVGQHFRVIAKRNAWATIGYSAGGYVAAMAAVLHPAQYGAGIVLRGYFHPHFGPFYRPFTLNSAAGRHYDLTRVARDHPPPVSLWVGTTSVDPLSYTTSATFVDDTRSPTAVHAVVLQNAGHRASVWLNLLGQALHWLGSRVRGFHP